MDRTEATNNVIVDGKRRYSTGIPQTIISANQLNSIEEEITHVIEGAGITPNKYDWTQLHSAIKSMIESQVQAALPPLPPGQEPYVPPTVESQFPAFEAYLPTDQYYIGNDTMQAVLFSVENFDTNNAYDAPNCCFRPNVAGIYLFAFHYYCEALGTHNGGSLSFWKNGVMYRNSNMPGGFLYNNTRGHQMVAMASAVVGDWFHCAVSQNTTGNVGLYIKKNGSYGYPITYWYGARVG